jgi:hypothetical protein
MEPYQTKLLGIISRIPDDLMIENIDLMRDEVIVGAILGDHIDKAVIAAFQWFYYQKDFKKVTISGLNGVDVMFIKRG